MNKNETKSKKHNKEITPEQIFKEYEAGINFKSSIGSRGLYDQAKMNERFYIGDQWHGAACGNDRPLVRHNIIKRIGDYKISMISASPISVNYSAEGIPNTVGIQKKVREQLDLLTQSADMTVFEDPTATNEEINLVMTAMSDYFRATAERLKFDTLKEEALRNAYISGAGVLYTYWDKDIMTGLYADEGKTKAIKGDISAEVLDIENVYLGDPNITDIQKQPYIIIAQRKSVKELRAEAKENGVSEYDIEKIKSDDNNGYEAGEYGNKESELSKKAVVLTKLYRVKENGNFTIKAVKVCKGVTIRKEWDLKIRLYPLAIFNWERRRNNAYGESEITYLIPNQIAINRMLTSSVWAILMFGMPMMLVNRNVVQDDFINEPGTIIEANGDAEEIKSAINYINPANFSPSFDNNIASLISNTLTQSGANDAALGNMRPDNTSAIIAVREAATMPLQTVQNRYYQFCEDIARIWAEFWVSLYGKRSIKTQESGNTVYMPFDAEKYKDLVITAKIDVGSSTLYGEAQTIATLDGLFDRQVIDVLQYIERLPKGIIPDVTGLIDEIKKANEEAKAMQEAQMAAMQGAVVPEQEIVNGLSPENQQIFNSLPPEQQQEMLNLAMGSEPTTAPIEQQMGGQI